MGRPKHRKIYILLVILFFMAGVLLGIRYFQSKESVEIRKKDAAFSYKKRTSHENPKRDRESAEGVRKSAGAGKHGNGGKG